MLILGGRNQGLYIIKTLIDIKQLQIVAVIDPDEQAPGLRLAKEMGIPTFADWQVQLDDIDIVINTAGDHLFNRIRPRIPDHAVLIPKTIVRIMAALIADKEHLIAKLTLQSEHQSLILNLTHDGMLAIDNQGCVTLLNHSAEKMMGVKESEAIGKPVASVIPSTKLPRILKTGKPEINQEQILANGRKIFTTRLPIKDKHGNPRGAFAVFKDITEVKALAEEVTNLKSIQTMLTAIIQSSEEAISVVDEHGKGIVINPAYTRLTGLTEKDVIGKPATTDISEGESMHMKVLQTRKPVRGARMKVGPAKRDVIVNVAPVIVEGELMGSVGVIQDMSEIVALTDELNRARQLIRKLEAKYNFDDIIGQSEDMQFVINQAKTAAGTPISVLLRGESGTGKELFAHAIHNASDRKYRKFIRVNCAAISETLLESEMFGYEEGAFSGAKKGGKRGYFEEADGGSIFLDEIGELTPHVQAKLLRVLQEKEIVRVGGTKAIPVDVRIITATNVNLEERMANGTFREDLYYRLNRLPIFIPPLRQRKSDIPELCDHLLNKINQDFGRNIESVDADALELLQNYHWPGNVRELENVLERIVIHMEMCKTCITADCIPPLSLNKQQVAERDPISETASPQPLAEVMNDYEKKVILGALVRQHYNKTKAARELGISVRNLYYKMEKHNLENNSMQ